MNVLLLCKTLGHAVSLPYSLRERKRPREPESRLLEEGDRDSSGHRGAGMSSVLRTPASPALSTHSGSHCGSQHPSTPQHFMSPWAKPATVPGLPELLCWAWREHTPTVKVCALMSVFMYIQMLNDEPPVQCAAYTHRVWVLVDLEGYGVCGKVSAVPFCIRSLNYTTVCKLLPSGEACGSNWGPKETVAGQLWKVISYRQ